MIIENCQLPIGRLRRRGFFSKSFLAGLALFILAAGYAVHRQHIYINNMKPYRPYLSANLIPQAESGDAVRALSLGWDEAASVFLWLRTIQDFGGQFRDPFALESLSNAFWTMAELTPLFTEMYDFGGLVIGDEGGALGNWETRVGESGAPGSTMQGIGTYEEAVERANAMLEQAIQFFEYGTLHDLDHYVHPYNASYICLYSLRTPRRGIPYAELAVTRPDCPNWVPGTIPYLQGRSGRHRVALALWFEQLRGDISTGEDVLIAIRLRKIAIDGVNPWNEQILTNAMRIWSDLHGGALPDSLQQILAEGYLLYYPDDLQAGVDLYAEEHDGQLPASAREVIEGGYLHRDPTQPPEEIRFFDYTRFLNEALVEIEAATPFAEITEEEFGLNNYLTVQGRLPECPLTLWSIHTNDTNKINQMQMIGPFTYQIDRREGSVKDSGVLFEDTARDLSVLRRTMDAFHNETDRWPTSLEELFDHIGAPMPLEPLTGQPYLYDPETGIVRSAAFSNVPEIVFTPAMGVPDNRPDIFGGARGTEVDAEPDES